MRERIYDDQLLTRYLLGALSSDETERLDELSITDDELAARLQALEINLIDGYVKGELLSEWKERFDSHYLSSQKRRERVAFARELQAVIEQRVATARAEQRQRTFAKPPGTEDRHHRNGFPRRNFFVLGSRLSWGLAAAALPVIVAGVWLAFENLRLRNEVTHTRAEREELQKREQELQARLSDQRSSYEEREKEIASLHERLAQIGQQASRQQARSRQPDVEPDPYTASFVLAPQTRGGGRMADISVPTGATYVTLQLELEPNDFASYRAKLKAPPDNRAAWTSGRLRARVSGKGKAVVVSLRADKLRSQNYILEVSGLRPAGADEIIGSYPFRVIK